MKWPQSLILIRHDVSSYNILKQLKENDPLYQEFVRSFEANSNCKKTRRLARKVASKFALGVSDQDTTLASEDDSRGLLVGQALRASNPLPDIVYLSPYARVLATFERICQGWPELASVARLEDERLREQEHGLATLYNDWRVFHTFFPEQAKFYAMQGSYWYRYPQGENIPDVRLRNNIQMMSNDQDTFFRKLSDQSTDPNIITQTNIGNIFTLRITIPIGSLHSIKFCLLWEKSMKHSPVIIKRSQAMLLFAQTLIFQTSNTSQLWPTLTNAFKSSKYPRIGRKIYDIWQRIAST
jgi:hypothetical protein